MTNELAVDHASTIQHSQEEVDSVASTDEEDEEVEDFIDDGDDLIQSLKMIKFKLGFFVFYLCLGTSLNLVVVSNGC